MRTLSFGRLDFGELEVMVFPVGWDRSRSKRSQVKLGGADGSNSLKITIIDRSELLLVEGLISSTL